MLYVGLTSERDDVTPTPLPNAEAGLPGSARGLKCCAEAGNLAAGLGERAGGCEREAMGEKGEAGEGGLEWGRETFPALRRVGETLAEVEAKVRLPLTSGSRVLVADAAIIGLEWKEERCL